MKVIAYQGETLDAICWRVLARTDCVEHVAELNPHTLDSPILAQGTVVYLPDDIPAPKVKETVTLWS